MFDSVLSKVYSPGEAEGVYELWEKNGYFTSAPKGDADADGGYCILLPPPNVTGTLHMGHAFQHTLMDILIRYQRMCGRNVLWQVGTDHAGIATQIVVTRQLEQAGVDPRALSRGDFLRKVWAWKEESGGIISCQMRRLGASADWSRECFTMDETRSAAVTEAFVRLYESGLIYRGKRLVNWDPAILTAVSDLEIVSEEEDGTMYYVRYPFVDDESDGIIIATTRPETILVDGAIAVNPDDERYKSLQGKFVWVPMTEPRRRIEIIADDLVEAEFGSGCVKITAAHDFNDYEMYRRHPHKNIPVIVLFTPDAKMNENAPKAYRGLDRFDARQKIVADLKEAGLLIKQEPHRYKLPRGDRSGVVVEPMLTDQWFMKMDDLAQQGLSLAQQKQLRFVPARWQKIYQQWLENIHDWCISRQLIWGHQIPAWYDEDGNIIVARNEEEAQQKAGSGKTLRRETDVLDTWFSSALWPFSTFSWPQTEQAYFARYFPTSVLITGFDIIFFWVARMAMMTRHFIGDTPFRDIYVTGLVRDHNGNKMSKSRGNVLDPLDIIDGIDLDGLIQKRTTGLMKPEQATQIAQVTRAQFPDGIAAYGADTLRFTFASLATHGNDIKFDMSRCEGYRHFCNKIWNAARFVLGVTAADKQSDSDDDADNKLSAQNLFIADDWIISRLQHTINSMRDSFAAYRFDLSAQALYQFFWDEFCDWYLECAKVQLAHGNAAVRRRTCAVLLQTLETGLRMSHPILPFISEQLWQKVAPAAAAKTADSIMLTDYPVVEQSRINADAETQMQQFMETVETARQYRNENPDAALTLYFAGDAAIVPHIKTLARIKDLRPVAASQLPADLPITQIHGSRFAPDFSANQSALTARWQKSLAATQAELAALDGTLANKQFLDKAPPAIVAKKKQRREELLATQADLQARLQKSEQNTAGQVR